MCTAVRIKTRNTYFGRTLDWDFPYPCEVTLTPREFPLDFRFESRCERHSAILGMAYVKEGYPLYFDAVSEQGLAMAGLNFVGNAVYEKPSKNFCNVAQFELIPFVLSRCATVKEATALLEKTKVTDTAFSKDLPPAGLHWMLADKDESAVLEVVHSGVKIYPNSVGVLTNNPDFPTQLHNLNSFMNLSPRAARNNFSEKLSFREYSRGMGAIGLPGDFSSQSRFVRGAFAALNSVCGDTEEESVGQFFHIMDTVGQPMGSCQVAEGAYERTLYTCCMNADKGIYYYTTYENRRISAIDMHRENLDSASLVRYPLIVDEDINIIN